MGSTNTTPTVSSNKWSKPGDIVIDSIDLISCAGFSVDIKLQMAAIVIYEDIFANALSGYINLIDTLNLSKHLPIIGNETIKIIFTTPGLDNQARKKISLSFKIFKVSSRQKIGGSQNQTFISLEFVSEEFFFNTGTKISKAYTGLSYSEMVSNIFSDYMLSNNEIDTESTTENGSEKLLTFDTYGIKNFIIPNWSPLYAINHLANLSSYMANTQMCDYVFYQNLEGIYYFVPISFMKSLAPVASFKHIPADHSTGKLMQNNARRISIVNFGDKMRDLSTGTFGSTLLTFDSTYKKIEYDIFSYNNRFSDQIHVSEFPILPRQNETMSEKIMAHRKFLPKHSYKYDGNPDNEGYLDFSLNRHSLMNQIGALGLEVDAPGDSRRRAGDIVEIEIVSQEDTSKKSEWRDTYMSGKYLITRIAHHIGNNDYNMIMSLTKDSYDEPVPDKKDAKISIA
jgi:hypothetical protein